MFEGVAGNRPCRPGGDSDMQAHVNRHLQGLPAGDSIQGLSWEKQAITSSCFLCSLFLYTGNTEMKNSEGPFDQGMGPI
jgi:hypothetical protein